MLCDAIANLTRVIHAGLLLALAERMGLSCVAACGGCHGRGCNNGTPVDLKQGTDEDDNSDTFDANIFEILF